MNNLANIVIEDEVNIHIKNIELPVKKALVNCVKFFLPNARYSYRYKMGHWDGTTSFCSLGGRSYLNILDKLLTVLQQHQYDFEIQDNRAYHDFKFQKIDENYLSDLTWPAGHRFAGEPILLRDYQVDAINTCLDNLQGVNVLPTSAGKCQPLTSKIKVPNGWTTMGEISVGDEVIIPDGSSAKVIGVYDPGSKDIYEITFEDGRKVKSCGDHVWKVHNHNWVNKWKLLSLYEVMEYQKTNKRRMSVPLVSMINDHDDVTLPMNPYLLGALLGDGSFRHNLFITSADRFILDKVSSTIDPDYSLIHRTRYDYSIGFASDKIHNDLRSAWMVEYPRSQNGNLLKKTDYKTYHKYKAIIKDLGLNGTHSHTKFIPRQYLDAGYKQRLDMINGLLDTDGYVDKKGCVSFTTVSKQLADDFAYLIRSIGGIAYHTQKTNKTYSYNGIRKECKDSYTVSIYHETPDILVTLPRKLERLRNRTVRKHAVLNITDIKKISTEPVKCIMIDHPDHLYITDDFVVTHNTIITSTLSKVIEPYGRSIVIVPNKNLVQQTEEDYRNIGLDVGVLFGDRKEYDRTHTICTWQSLNVLDKKNKDAFDYDQMEVFLKDLVCVICDECHMVKDTNILHGLMTGPFRNIPIRWGLTGTIPEEEYKQMGLFTAIGPQVGILTAKELQDKGVLAKCNVQVLQTQETVQYGSYQSELKFLVTDEQRLKWMAQTIESIATNGNTLVLVDRIETGEKLWSQMSGAVFISGEMKSNDRREHYKDLNFSDNKIMVATFGTTSTGISINRIFNLVLVECGKSLVRVLQSIGRGLRMAEDKDHVDIYDICSKMKFSNSHLTKRKQLYKKVEYPYDVKKISY